MYSITGVFAQGAKHPLFDYLSFGFLAYIRKSFVSRYVEVFLRTCAEILQTKSSNAGLFAHIRKSFIGALKFLRVCAETPKL